MKKTLIISMSTLLLIPSARAAAPLWTFTPLTATNISIKLTEKVTIKYRLVNKSKKTRTLMINPINGITQITSENTYCKSPSVLEPNQSCVLTFQIDGNKLNGDVLGGPIVCNRGKRLQCFQPKQVDSIAIRLVPKAQQYRVASSPGVNGSITPKGLHMVNYGSSISFMAIANPGYGVNQWFIDGNLVQIGGTSYELTNITSNHEVNVTFGQVTLVSSISSLALAVACSTSKPSCATVHSSLTGNLRKIMVTNNGSASATNLAVSTSGLPSGTSISATTCNGTLNAGHSCMITIVPGAVASTDSNNNECTSGTQPIPSIITVTADGGLSTQINTYVLGYGCIYQGGFIYSVDDTQGCHQNSCEGSIGGKIAAVTDTHPGQPLNSSGFPNWGGIGTDIGNQTNETSSIGANNGIANTLAIVNALGCGPANANDIAACLCNSLSVNEAGAMHCIPANTCYTDWYLPALCELRPYQNTNICTPGNTNIQQQLFENPNISNAILGLVDNSYYWSSTQFSSNPQSFAWMEYFSTNGSGQDIYFKDSEVGIRCSRVLTP
jgi:hypothetical protein